MPSFTRRALLAGAALTAGAAALRLGAGPSWSRELPRPAQPAAGRTVEVDLVAAERPTALPAFAGKALPLWTFAGGPSPPVIRLRLGDRLRARLTNALPHPDQHASIHWHGIRLPNTEDGVPYLTQPPVLVGGSHTYDFVPPDTGTFFFHTHCNTAEQLGRGLYGVLIVEGDAERPYDADEVVVLRDWRLDDEAAGFLPFYTAAGAARQGSYGALRTANGASNPAIFLPGRGDCRIRLLNVDPTRVMELDIEGAEAAIIAIDGMAVPPMPLPWRTGPATRLDLALRAPVAGRTAQLYDYFAADPVLLAHFVGRGPDRPRRRFDPAPLRAPRIAPPDLARAERLRFELSATSTPPPPGDGLPLGVLCRSEATLWAINRQPWPARQGEHLPPPLANFTRGKTYRIELANLTPQVHPIHIHGHSFTVLGSSKRKLPRHIADTTLLLADERISIAFVADNPGDWMIHCHLIEHQESGMMGYFRVA